MAGAPIHHHFLDERGLIGDAANREGAAGDQKAKRGIGGQCGEADVRVHDFGGGGVGFFGFDGFADALLEQLHPFFRSCEQDCGFERKLVIGIRHKRMLAIIETP
jgi:hypothetical protein